jgi:hypothetical protein
MADVPVTLAVEGVTDAVVLKRVLQDMGLQPGPEYISGGKASLDQRLAGYNAAARFAPWLVLRDLNGDADCAPRLVQRLLPRPSGRMRLQVAVRAVEAWLMADPESLGRFLSVSTDLIPTNPEATRDPKAQLVNLARRSRRRAVREAMVPAERAMTTVGPGYSSLVVEFSRGPWRPRAAQERSPSLRRLMRYLEAVRAGQ